MKKLQKDPSSARQRQILALHLDELLDGHPNLCEELHTLLKAENTARLTTQTANVQGDQNQTVQLSGSRNQVGTSR